MKVKVFIFSFYGFESFGFAELYHKCVILSMFFLFCIQNPLVGGNSDSRHMPNVKIILKSTINISLDFVSDTW